MKKIIIFLVFVVFFMKTQAQNCTIENQQAAPVGFGNSWIRQSFTPETDLSNVTISMSVYSYSPFNLVFKLYQGGVWEENPVLISTSNPISVNVTWSLWPDGTWFSFELAENIVLMANQEYFVEISDQQNYVSVFTFAITSDVDHLPNGERRNPYFEISDNQFSDCVILVQGDCAQCFGDFNQDTLIGVADLVIFLGNFGCISDCDEEVDINDDGIIGIDDLVLFISVFGTTCP